MGDGFLMKCRSCGREDEYLLGIGMYYSYLDEILDAVIQGKQRNKIRSILNSSEHDNIDYGHRLYTCPRCDTLHNRFYIHIQKGDQTVYRSHFRCGKCRSVLVDWDKRVTAYRCRHCGQQTAEFAGSFLWD
jgi:hypothetical protein